MKLPVLLNALNTCSFILDKVFRKKKQSGQPLSSVCVNGASLTPIISDGQHGSYACCHAWVRCIRLL